jgi:hexosaminidase
MKNTLAWMMLSTAAFAQSLPLIPRPKDLQTGEGFFAFSAETAIRFDRQLAAETGLLAEKIERLTGQKTKTVAEELRIHLASEISLDLDAGLPLKRGGYRMTVTPGGVKIVGKDAAGAFAGAQTLLQLLPAQAPMPESPVKIPALQISDEPEFAWRGMHLDCGRHFFPLEDLKKFIDQMAFHKLNVFHWHLTEDQGWRIEIKKYPKLTEVGAFRDSTPPYGNRNSDDKKRYGGFYTQEQVRELVAYASARHITIVPEIELPGHAAAAIAAYPQFGNTDIPNYHPQVMTRWGVHPYVFAPKEETFAFLEDVLTEVCALFPSKFIHIGGDEAPKSQWNQSKFAKEVMQREGLKNADELQSYFIRRIEKFLASKNRSLVGWDEIQEGGLPKSATMMVWRDLNWARHALDLGNNVVMAPNAFAYLDHYQRPASEELSKGPEYEAIGGFLPVSKLYGYDPASVARNDKERGQILGVQAQLWTEYMKDWKKVEYMAFPRIAALAEIAWLPKDKKDYEDFRARLDGVMKFYDALGINRAVPLDPPKKETKDGSVIETSLSVYGEHAIDFAYDGRADTFFWAGRALKKDDHVTLRLKTPPGKEAMVTVQTGGKASKNGDSLENGELQYSLDGMSWKKVADFSAGKASGNIPAGTKAVRVLVTAPQEFWLILHEIIIE